MNERLLQFIWQFQYFNKSSLVTTQGEPVYVMDAGTWNHHQGPDFSTATVRIGHTTWVGNIEIHILSSDWYRHRHPGDKHYQNIILHVVWKDDMPVHADNGSLIPCLVLDQLVSRHLLERYDKMMRQETVLPCSHFLPALSHLAWTSWKERLMAERLERKAAHVLRLLGQTRGHWEEVCWQMLAANLGIQVNSALFGAVAQSLPLSVLIKHKHNPLQVEAMLMGQANLLTGIFKDSYPLLLQREHTFFSRKYKLPPVTAQPAFLRMRPAAFPTVRISQLAAIVVKNDHLFSVIKETPEIAAVTDLFRVTAAAYWNTHYLFDEAADHHPKQLGAAMAGNLIINTVVPVLFAYGLHTHDETCKQKAMQWLYQLPAEHNRITRSWKETGIANHSALDSQSLIELTNHYCTQKRCLDCSVGNKILKG